VDVCVRITMAEFASRTAAVGSAIQDDFHLSTCAHNVCRIGFSSSSLGLRHI
jgi:hypothetical protein